VNLPPTLSKSQVSSVRKNLKMQMLALLKLPDAVEFHYNITTLLTDLGATQSEVCVVVLYLVFHAVAVCQLFY